MDGNQIASVQVQRREISTAQTVKFRGIGRTRQDVLYYRKLICEERNNWLAEGAVVKLGMNF